MFTPIASQSSPRPPLKYGAVSYWLTVLCILLLTVVVLAAGTLGLLYRADARAALGNAKTVRLALQAASTECYGVGADFSDPSRQGGVTEAVYQTVLQNSRAPGEFWLLQTGENGYGVQVLLYEEGAFTVRYTADPTQWEVRGTLEFIHAVP